MNFLIIDGVDITHSRLVDLTKLADQAKPFYDWVEAQFKSVVSMSQTLDEILQTAKPDEIQAAITHCYSVSRVSNLPLLFDGVGRSYPHNKACYYFFSWIIRDAPQQRLAPLIQRIVKNSGKRRLDAEVEAITKLICKYRADVKTFEWQAIREIIIDRLEGSRRSIKGHEKETIVRTALLMAIQSYYYQNGHYGKFSGIEIADTQIMVGNESFDVSINLMGASGNCEARILVPIKTRETEGGGHSHLFTRDITSAINSAKFDNPDDYLIVVIVAKNWSEREAENIRALVDHAAIFDQSPNQFTEFSSSEQEKLNNFFSSVFNGVYLRSNPVDTLPLGG